MTLSTTSSILLCHWLPLRRGVLYQTQRAASRVTTRANLPP